jgi:hypothetical protein
MNGYRHDGRLGRFVVRRRRAVILAWIALLIVTATIGSAAFSVLSTGFDAGHHEARLAFAKALIFLWISEARNGR